MNKIYRVHWSLRLDQTLGTSLVLGSSSSTYQAERVKNFSTPEKATEFKDSLEEAFKRLQYETLMRVWIDEEDLL